MKLKNEYEGQEWYQAEVGDEFTITSEEFGSTGGLYPKATIWVSHEDTKKQLQLTGAQEAVLRKVNKIIGLKITTKGYESHGKQCVGFNFARDAPEKGSSVSFDGPKEELQKVVDNTPKHTGFPKEVQIFVDKCVAQGDEFKSKFGKVDVIDGVQIPFEFVAWSQTSSFNDQVGTIISPVQAVAVFREIMNKL